MIVFRQPTVMPLIGWLVYLLALSAPSSAVAQDAPVKALVESYNASGQALFKKFAAARGNIVFSPYSIGSATAMALSGARGETAAQMAKVLKINLDRAAMDAANASVFATLNNYDKSADAPTCPDDMRWNGERCEAPAKDGRCSFMARREGELCVAEPLRRPASAQLRVANAVMQAKGDDHVAKDYAALLKDKYGADVLQGVTVKDVNNWVKRKTAGKIDRIIDSLPNVVLLNAIYFKARWETTFSKGATQDKPFNLSRTQKVPVPTMTRTGSYSMIAGTGYRAIRLPYDVPELAMVIVLPTKIDGVNRVAAELGASELAGKFAALRDAPPKRVELSMPRFKTSFKADNLADIFRQAGMKLAFDRSKADFSGITGKPPSELKFWIDEIRHRAVIEVMEDGTEAAAVTAIGFRAASIPPKEPDPEVFKIDRPFLFYIVDSATGAVLFQGRISDPRGNP